MARSIICGKTLEYTGITQDDARPMQIHAGRVVDQNVYLQTPYLSDVGLELGCRHRLGVALTYPDLLNATFILALI